jgi:hypothetical protein
MSRTTQAHNVVTCSTRSCDSLRRSPRANRESPDGSDRSSLAYISPSSPGPAGARPSKRAACSGSGRTLYLPKTDRHAERERCSQRTHRGTGRSSAVLRLNRLPNLSPPCRRTASPAIPNASEWLLWQVRARLSTPNVSLLRELRATLALSVKRKIRYPTRGRPEFPTTISHGTQNLVGPVTRRMETFDPANSHKWNKRQARRAVSTTTSLGSVLVMILYMRCIHC